MPDPTGAKNVLRQGLLARRAALTAGQVRALSGRILDRIRGLPAWAGAATVLTYMPIRNEVDVTPLLDELWARGARVLLPRCRPGRTGIMDLARATCLADLRPGAHGIAEPDPATCPMENDPSPDLALVPGVAFDRQGFRLGFGAGYYDRLLAAPGMERTLLAGPAYAFQVLDSLPVEPWDRPVHAVITEENEIWT